MSSPRSCIFYIHCTSPGLFWICVKGAHLKVESGMRGREGGREGRRTKQAVLGSQAGSKEHTLPLLTKEVCEVFMRLNLIMPSSWLPRLAFLHSLYIFCLLRNHSFIRFQVLKSSLVFGSPHSLCCPLFPGNSWQLVVPPQ